MPWNLQKNLALQERSLGRTYKINTEANAQVHDLNQKTMKGLDTLAILYSRFEKVSNSPGEADQMFDKDFVVMQEAMIRGKDTQRFEEMAAEQVYDRLDQYHRLSEECESAEDDLNEGLVCIRDLVRDTAAAAHALSCGTNDRDSNEEKYLQEALEIVGEFCAPGYRPRRL